jgi:hypothetical protein
MEDQSEVVFVVGCTHRLAPEILDHENTEYDERSDIYR